MDNSEIYCGWKNSTGGFTIASLVAPPGNMKPRRQPNQVAFATKLSKAPPEWAKLSFRFCRPLNHLNPVTPKQYYIYASDNVGPTVDVDSPGADYPVHSGPYGSFQFDFTTPESDPVSSEGTGQPILNPTASFTKQTVYIIHGIIMAVAWLVCPFVGLLVARFMKFKLGAWWFRIHMIVMGIVCLLGTILATLLVFLYRNPPHFYSTKSLLDAHVKFGLAILIACVLQVVLGVICDWKFDSSRTEIPVIDKLHAWFGRVLVLGGIINVYLGLAYYESVYAVNIAIKIVFFVGVAIAVGIFAWLEYKIGPTNHVALKNNALGSAPTANGTVVEILNIS
jgi:hypothetical protein